MIKRLLIVVLVSLAAASLAWSEADAPMVPETVTVRGEQITLAHLVQAAGVTAGDHLRRVVLMKSPHPGQSRTLSGAYVKQKLADAGLDYIATPPRIRVERPGFRIDPATGREVVIEHIRSRAPWPADRYDIEIVRDHMPLTAEPGHVAARIYHSPSDNLAGTHTYVVEYRVDGHPAGRGSFTVRVHVQATVYVAAHQLNRGVLLSDRDLVPKRVDLADIRALPETDRSKLLGARIRHTIREGEIVTEAALDPVPVVRRGDAVVVVARRDKMVVTAFGVAKENGALGEVIRVENVQSKRVVHARVENSNTVVVLF
ncbi:MAG: flagellar basal body P-ring formation chaperone FlgA [Candidatus Lernaella stagnicola]|nr:flagellar basal body P-ring formation chaperone FlgA [Candidatus Lernaella stagnicola]